MNYIFRFLSGGLLALLLLVGQPSAAQSPAWQLVAQSTQTTYGSTQVSDCATDAAGNVFMTGELIGTAVFGSITLSSAGSFDVFVAKWSPVSNSFVWAIKLGGTNEEHALGLAVDNGNVYVVGDFNSPIMTAGPFSCTNAGPASSTSDGFLVKVADIGSAGVFEWAKSLGGVGAELANAVAVAGNDLYVTGTFGGSSFTIGSTVLYSAGYISTFVTKLADTGTEALPVWAWAANGGCTRIPEAIAVNGTSIYVGGNFYAGGQLIVGSSVVESAGYSDAYILKLTDAGTAAQPKWARSIGGTGSDALAALAVVGSNVYATGALNSPAVTIGNSVLTSSGNPTAFVAKLLDISATPQFVWGQQSGGTGIARAYAIQATPASIYITGAFSGTASFGNTTLTSQGLDDVYAAKLFDVGNGVVFNWALPAGGVSYDFGNGIALSGSRIYVAGIASPPANFGTLGLAGTSGGVCYVAAIADAIPTASATGTALAGLVFFPNPAHGRSTIQIPAIPAVATATVTVLDALGRMLRTQTVATNATTELDLASLPVGLYAVRVQAGGSTATRRLVVE